MGAAQPAEPGYDCGCVCALSGVLWEGLCPASKLISQFSLSTCLKTCLKTRQALTILSPLPVLTCHWEVRHEDASECQTEDFGEGSWADRSSARSIHTAGDGLFGASLEGCQLALHVCCRITASLKKCSKCGVWKGGFILQSTCSLNRQDMWDVRSPRRFGFRNQPMCWSNSSSLWSLSPGQGLAAAGDVDGSLQSCSCHGWAGKEQHQNLCVWIPFLQHKEIRAQVLDSEPADPSDVPVYSVPPGGFCRAALSCHLLTAHAACPRHRGGSRQDLLEGLSCTPWAAGWLPAALWSFENNSCVFISRTTLQHSPCCTGLVPPRLKVEFSYNIAVKLLKEFNVAYFTPEDDYRKIFLSAHELF